MKTVIVYYHPYNGSFCHALLENLMAEAQAQGQAVDIIDLSEDKFNPVMTGQDLLGFIKHQPKDPVVLDYGERLAKADQLIMIFPIWWELMPAMVKGFIDKVVFPGLFYDYTSSGYGMVNRLKNLKKIRIVTTMNTPKVMYAGIYGNALKKALVKGTFKKAGYKDVKWISFNMVKQSSPKKREKWLKQVRKII